MTLYYSLVSLPPLYKASLGIYLAFGALQPQGMEWITVLTASPGIPPAGSGDGIIYAPHRPTSLHHPSQNVYIHVRAANDPPLPAIRTTDIPQAARAL